MLNVFVIQGNVWKIYINVFVIGAFAALAIVRIPLNANVADAVNTNIAVIDMTVSIVVGILILMINEIKLVILLLII